MRFVWVLLLLLNVQLLSAQRNRITYVKMERTPCFGKCPAYQIELFRNGKVTYYGASNVDRLGMWHGELKASEVAALYRTLKNKKIATLKNAYPVLSTDLPGMNLIILNNGKKKYIRHANAGPDYLELFAKQIDKAIETVQWDKVAIQDVPVNDFPYSSGSGEEAVTSHPLNPSDIMHVVDEMPSFPGGQEKMSEYIAANLRYPKQAIENGIRGKVICSMVINKEGMVTDVKVLKGIGGGCDEEALRVLRAMPRWKPGKYQGKPANVFMNIPINFELK